MKHWTDEYLNMNRLAPTVHDESQCWEPCGQLGKSEAHAQVAGDVYHGGHNMGPDFIPWSKEDEMFGSRIDVIGQNGNDGLHYDVKPSTAGTFEGQLRVAFKPGAVKVLQQWVQVDGPRGFNYAWVDVPEVVLDD